jgi:hypothetical protein
MNAATITMQRELREYTVNLSSLMTVTKESLTTVHWQRPDAYSYRSSSLLPKEYSGCLGLWLMGKEDAAAAVASRCGHMTENSCQ